MALLPPAPDGGSLAIDTVMRGMKRPHSAADEGSERDTVATGPGVVTASLNLNSSVDHNCTRCTGICCPDSQSSCVLLRDERSRW